MSALHSDLPGWVLSSRMGTLILLWDLRFLGRQDKDRQTIPAGRMKLLGRQSVLGEWGEELGVL